MNESENTSRVQSQRGYTEDEVWYHYSSEQLSSEERRAGSAVAEVAVGIHDLEVAISELSALRALLYVVNVSSVVLEDVLALCQGCTEVMEAICSTRATLTGRARAGASREARASRRQAQR